ncbi:MAG TPA: DUF2282 domain-containing protein [Steroidobacteraceae bacterium]|nr:DUF2282 domain-containing protein [Steroidobacteraceae bacterium]
MNIRNLAIAAAVGSLVALGAQSATAGDMEQGKDKEKCYGVAKAGKNDCASGSHACAGHAKADNDPAEWKYVPKGECEKMGGSLAAAKKPM